MQNQTIRRVLLAGSTCLAVILSSSTVLAAEMTDLRILKSADHARGNIEGVTWNVKIVSNERDEVQQQHFAVRARGFDVLATTTLPPKHRGNKILMVSRNMWFYKKGLAKPVPIALRQKLQGQAAYGDIPSTNYTDDYASSRRSDETVRGEPCHVFDLKAKNKTKSTYDSIRYWVSRRRLVGVKADYFTVSGKCIKRSTMRYENVVVVDGKNRPFISEIEFRDFLTSKAVTTMSFDSPELGPIPRHVFDLNLLVK